MTRVSIDLIELYLVESGVALEAQLYPLRLSTCNLHGESSASCSRSQCVQYNADTCCSVTLCRHLLLCDTPQTPAVQWHSADTCCYVTLCRHLLFCDTLQTPAVLWHSADMLT